MKLSPSSHIAPRAAQISPQVVTGVSPTRGQWLVLQRRARGWNVAHMARKLREAATSAGDKLPSRDSLIVMIHRWESDRSGISERYRLHYCRAFQIPIDLFGNPAALDLPANGTGRHVARQIPGKHLGAEVTRLLLPSLTSRPTGLAGQLPAVRDRMHAAVDQLCEEEDRDQFCFLLGYLSALVTALPRTPGERAGQCSAESSKVDSRDD